jgi:lysophospholipase L1-like esterase
MPGLTQSQSLAWGCEIRRPLLLLTATAFLITAETGCSSISQFNPNVAFMGDSITAHWWLPKTNLGIPGDTTTQMLNRFSDQVLGHGYRAVVILGGTNDVHQTNAPIEKEVNLAMSNIEQMTALAEKENLVVVLCDIPPIGGENERSQALNAAIDSFAQEHQYKLVDYYTPLAGHPEYFLDYLHPNSQGYFVMQTTLTKVIPQSY